MFNKRWRNLKFLTKNVEIVFDKMLYGSLVENENKNIIYNYVYCP